jgi:hypothetical protein
MAHYDPNAGVRIDFCLADRDMLHELRDDVKEILACHKKHGERISKVERWQLKISAVAGFVGMVLGWLVPESLKALFHGWHVAR